jgi:hypothetical protein
MIIMPFILLQVFAICLFYDPLTSPDGRGDPHGCMAEQMVLAMSREICCDHLLGVSFLIGWELFYNSYL